MKLRVPLPLALGLAIFPVLLQAQSPPPPPEVEPVRFDQLARKLDEANTKIDALSQQLLKVEQQLTTMSKPGVMIGEPTPAAPPVTPSAAGTMSDPAKPVAPASSSNSHVIAKGETLTALAKMYKVGVEDLQKFNHIENDRKLQVGQTIFIPAGAIAPSASPAATPNP